MPTVFKISAIHWTEHTCEQGRGPACKRPIIILGGEVQVFLSFNWRERASALADPGKLSSAHILFYPPLTHTLSLFEHAIWFLAFDLFPLRLWIYLYVGVNALSHRTSTWKQTGETGSGDALRSTALLPFAAPDGVTSGSEHTGKGLSSEPLNGTSRKFTVPS